MSRSIPFFPLFFYDVCDKLILLSPVEVFFLNQRLKELRKTLGLNQTEFARYLGITQTAYSMIENGLRPLATKYVKVICSTFQVNELWLCNGDGEMFLASRYEKEFAEIFSHLLPETQQYLLLMAKELLKTQYKLLNTANGQTSSCKGEHAF